MGNVASGDDVLVALTQSAEDGDGEAQVILGQIYSRGDGVVQDDLTAAMWFEQAAENGEALGQYYYGWMLQEGYGVARNRKLALEWYQQAADQGLGIAAEMVTFLNQQNPEEGKPEITELKERNEKNNDYDISVTNSLSVPVKQKNYIMGSIEFLNIRRDYNKQAGDSSAFLDLIIKKNLKKHPEEMNFIGFLLTKIAHKDVRKKDDASFIEAYNYFLDAAQSGSPSAQYNLAYAYLLGQGTDVDIGAAERWLNIANDTLKMNIPSNYKELSAQYSQASEYKDSYSAARQGYESAAGQLRELIQLGLNEIKARRRMNN